MVQEVLKQEDDDCEITLKEIRDTVWYYYFDVEKSINYLLGKQFPK